MSKKTKLPTISVSLIVRDEENNLKRLLPTLVKCADEVVVCDTGSTDNTKKIVRKNKAKLVEFPWNDSFSDARNYCLDHCTKDYILWLDADDYIEPESFSIIKRHLQFKPNTAVFLILEDYRGGGVFSSYQLRIVPNDKRLRFRGRIHEQISFSVEENGIPYSYLGISIKHFGYNDETVVKQKLERNLKLLERELEENPNDFLTLINTAKTLIGIGRIDDAEPIVEKSLALYRQGNVQVSKDTAVFAFINKITILSFRKEYDKVVEFLEDSKQYLNDNIILLTTLGECYFIRKDYINAYKNLRILKQRELQPSLIPIELDKVVGNLYYYLLISSLAVADLDMTEFAVKKLTDDNNFKIPKRKEN